MRCGKSGLRYRRPPDAFSSPLCETSKRLRSVPDTVMRDCRLHLVHYIVIGVLAASVYLNTLDADFAYDDK